MHLHLNSPLYGTPSGPVILKVNIHKQLKLKQGLALQTQLENRVPKIMEADEDNQ